MRAPAWQRVWANTPRENGVSRPLLTIVISSCIAPSSRGTTRPLSGA